MLTDQRRHVPVVAQQLDLPVSEFEDRHDRQRSPFSRRVMPDLRAFDEHRVTFFCDFLDGRDERIEIAEASRKFFDDRGGSDRGGRVSGGDVFVATIVAAEGRNRLEIDPLEIFEELLQRFSVAHFWSP